MKSFLWKIYFYSFLSQFILIYPVYAILFQSEGLSTFQLSSLFALLAATQVILEVPMGVLADKYSRRNLLILAQILKGVGFSFWLFGHSYIYFAVGFFLWGVAGTLNSGTFEALVYDELKAARKEKQYERVNGRIRAASSIGIMLAVLLGGAVSEHGYVYALVPSIMAPLVAAIVLLTLSPVQKTGSTGEKRYWQVLKLALTEATHKPALLQLMTYMALVFGIGMAADDFWSLLYNHLGLSLALIGIIFAIANAVGALASYTAHHWRISPRQEYLLVLLSGILLLLVGWWHTPWSAILTFGTVFCMQLASVKTEARLQHSISSNQRATVSSLNSLLLQIMVIIFTLIIGAVSTRFGIPAFLYIFGAVTVTTATIFLFLAPVKNASRKRLF